MNVEKIPLTSLQAAVHSLEERHHDALSAWKCYRDNHAIKKASEKQRLAYLQGVLCGLNEALKEFEKRCPLSLS